MKKTLLNSIAAWVALLAASPVAAYYEFVTAWGSEGTNTAQLGLVMSLATDNEGKLYVADLGNKRVQVFGPEGTFITHWPCATNSVPLTSCPGAVAVSPSGQVFVTESAPDRSKVYVFDSQGNLVTNLFERGQAPGQINFPQGMTFDSAGNLYIADWENSRIQKFDSNGNLLMHFGSQGTTNGQFRSLGNVAVDSSGNIYTLDLFNGLQKFSSNGQFIQRFDPGAEHLKRWDEELGAYLASGLAVDRLGNVVVADSIHSNVIVFSPHGQFISKFSHSPASMDVEFYPGACVVDSAGDLFVYDGEAFRIVKFRLGPHGWWKFNEGAGTIATNSGIHGVGGNATLTNGVAFSSDTPHGSASSVRFPSTGSGAGTPAVETSSSYDPLAGATKFTVAAWVKRESSSNASNTAARIVSDINSLGTTASGFEFRFSGTNGVLTVNINGTERSTTTGMMTPTAGTWRHVAVVYDGTRPATNTLTRHVHFYVDGIQRGDGNTLAGMTVGSNTNRLTIGNSAVSRDVLNTLVGKIDEVRVYRDFAPDAVGNAKTNSAILSLQGR